MSGIPGGHQHPPDNSPIADDDGRVARHLCVVTEQTDWVILAQRRMAPAARRWRGHRRDDCGIIVFVAIEGALSASDAA